MGVFQEGDYGTMSDSPKSAERCKRDYEADIASAKKLKSISKELLTAIANYIDIAGKGEKQFTLTGLYGSLVLQDRDIDKAILRLQDQWESEK